MEMLIKKWNILLLLLARQQLQCFELIRDFTRDEMSCSTESINCTDFESIQLDSSTCECTGGTYFDVDNRLVCIKNKVTTGGCDFMFTGFENNVRTITVEGDVAKNFNEDIISKSVNCYGMDSIYVEYLDKNLKWLKTPTQDFSVIAPSQSQKFYIRWKNHFEVDKNFYRGKLLKFHFNCTQIQRSKTSRGCAYGKIIGSSMWSDDDAGDVCKLALIPPPTLNPIYRNVTKSQLTTPTTDSGKPDMTLIGSVIATILLILFVVVIVIFCVRRRRVPKQGVIDRQSEGDDDVRKPTLSPSQHQDYVDPNEVFQPNGNLVNSNNKSNDFENKGYLTTIRSESINNNSLYDLPTHPQPPNRHIKKTHTIPAKPTSATIQNNVYEPIFSDDDNYDDPDHENDSSYTELCDIDSTKPRYDTLNNLSNERNDSESYMDMSDDYSTPIYE